MTKKRENRIASVIRDYNRRLFRFIRGRVPTNADAEDILQDVWFQLSKVVDLDSIEQISGWLFRVARNRVTDSYRKRQPERLEDQTFDDGEGMLALKDILSAETSSPEMDNLKELFWESLFEALDELPEAQREVFIWNELEDQTFQEISDRTGVNIKTLISRKRYAVKHLRERLDDLYREFVED
ncbi:MAG: sigma-70 family RNA polymerase sigma factor [Bacteroidota bacterium]